MLAKSTIRGQPGNHNVTHLVMQEGHLWGQKDLIIPFSAMGETREDTVS